MEGFKLLTDWLDPIESPPDDGTFVGYLNTNYDSQQICKILQIKPGQLLNGYKETARLFTKQEHIS